MAIPEQCEAQVEPRSLLRQGAVLQLGDAAGFDPDGSEGDLLIVVSHDCDCVQPSINEPYVELMPARIIEAPNGNYTNAKSARTLHLPARKGETEVTLEIKARPKIAVHKTATLKMTPDASIQIAERDRRTLSIWLRSRYSRTALPDAFNERLRDVESAIEDAIRPHSKAFHGLYISLDPQSEIPEDQIYELDLFIVYDEEIRGAREAAEAAADKIDRRFERKFKRMGTPKQPITWTKIHLSNCVAISDTQFTLADILKVQRLNFDHFSLRQDPQVRVSE